MPKKKEHFLQISFKIYKMLRLTIRLLGQKYTGRQRDLLTALFVGQVLEAH
jgi:hypothetical protein